MPVQRVRIVNKVKVEVTNDAFNTWFEEENARRQSVNTATIALLVAQLAQLVLYYSRFKNNLSRRDDEIDNIVSFLQVLQNYKHGADLAMLQRKATALSIELPILTRCEDIARIRGYAKAWGASVDNKTKHLGDESCGGIPSNWAVHDGSLLQARAAANAGGLVSNQNKRLLEEARYIKNKLVQRAQHNMKGPFNANDILQRYAQSMSIYSGLSDLYIQGFNSAGAGLGVILGRLSNGTTGGASGSNNTGGYGRL